MAEANLLLLSTQVRGALSLIYKFSSHLCRGIICFLPSARVVQGEQRWLQMCLKNRARRKTGHFASFLNTAEGSSLIPPKGAAVLLWCQPVLSGSQGPKILRLWIGLWKKLSGILLIEVVFTENTLCEAPGNWSWGWQDSSGSGLAPGTARLALWWNRSHFSQARIPAAFSMHGAHGPELGQFTKQWDKIKPNKNLTVSVI